MHTAPHLFVAVYKEISDHQYCSWSWDYPLVTYRRIICEIPYVVTLTYSRLTYTFQYKMSQNRNFSVISLQWSESVECEIQDTDLTETISKIIEIHLLSCSWRRPQGQSLVPPWGGRWGEAQNRYLVSQCSCGRRTAPTPRPDIPRSLWRCGRSNSLEGQEDHGLNLDMEE